jgi:hypothetical protein
MESAASAVGKLKGLDAHGARQDVLKIENRDGFIGFAGWCFWIV